MSWKGLTKAVARIPARLSRNSAGSRDEEYEALEEIFKRLDTVARKLSADTKQFKDSLSLMLSHQSSLAEVFIQIYEPFDPQIKITPEIQIVRDFAIAMKNAKDVLHSDLEQIERLVVAPTSDFITILDQIKRVLTKRQHKELDYYRHGDTLKSLQEKDRSVSDEKKLAQITVLYENAQRDYTHINNIVKQDLTIFLSKKKDFIDPCLLTFYNYQVRVYQTLYGIFYEIGKSKFDLSTTAMEGYDRKRNILEEMMKSLTLANPTTPTAPPQYDETSSTNVFQNTSGMSSDTFRPQPPTPLNEKKDQIIVVALYDFTAQAEGDLTFKKNDKIEVLEMKDQNDWWVGKMGNRIGQFPGNYVAAL